MIWKIWFFAVLIDAGVFELNTVFAQIVFNKN